MTNQGKGPRPMILVATTRGRYHQPLHKHPPFTLHAQAHSSSGGSGSGGSGGGGSSGSACNRPLRPQTCQACQVCQLTYHAPARGCGCGERPLRQQLSRRQQPPAPAPPALPRPWVVPTSPAPPRPAPSREVSQIELQHHRPPRRPPRRPLGPGQRHTRRPDSMVRTHSQHSRQSYQCSQSSSARACALTCKRTVWSCHIICAMYG
jgi:hypothetical protein